MGAVGEGEENVTRLADWTATEDEMLSTELNVDAPLTEAFDRRTVHPAESTDRRS